MSDIKDVIVFLDSYDEGYCWVVRKCPFCGGRHYHGAGNIKLDPYCFLGCRLSHCCGKQYNLVPFDNKQIAQTGEE